MSDSGRKRVLSSMVCIRNQLLSAMPFLSSSCTEEQRTSGILPRVRAMATGIEAVSSLVTSDEFNRRGLSLEHDGRQPTRAQGLTILIGTSP